MNKIVNLENISPKLRQRIAWLNIARLEHRSIIEAIMRHSANMRGPLLDVGCGVKPYRELFPHIENYIGVDPLMQEGVDVGADVRILPFKERVFGTVLATQVLFEIKSPEMFFKEVYRVLQPGGHLLMTEVQSWGLMKYPEIDYWRFTDKGLALLATAAGFEIVSMEPRGGKWMLIGARLSSAIWYSFRTRRFTRRYLSWLGRFICGVVQSLFDWLDQVDYAPGDTLGWCFVGKKTL